MRVNLDHRTTDVRSLDTSEEGAEGSHALPAPVEEAVTDWLVAATQGAPALAPARLATWRHVVAALVHDSQHHRQIAGARSVLMQQRRLLFEADGMGIDLEVDQSRIAGRLRMLGQIVAETPAPPGARAGTLRGRRLGNDQPAATSDQDAPTT